LPDYLLGIDIGTNSCKTALFDMKGRPVAKSSKEYAVHYSKPTWAEQDADVWWDATKTTVKEVLKAARNARRSVVGVGVDSQREAPVPLDAKGRKLDTSPIWLDMRTMPQVAAMKRLLSSRKVLETAGVPVDYFYSAAKMLWLKQERPRVFSRTKCFLFPKDYVIYKLTGEKATDFSMASRTMLLDIKKRRWSQEICDRLGISIDLLPRVVESTHVVGEVTSNASGLTGLEASVRVVSGGGDRPVEAVGAGVAETGQVNIGTGTATVMTTPLPKPKVDLKGRVDCCCHVIPHMWEYEPTILTTGASLRWFRDNFAQEEIEKGKRTGVDAYEYLSDLAAGVPPGSEGLFYYPYPMGAKSPKFNTNAKAVFFGLSLIHTKAHFVRSIFEGIAFQYAETLELLRELGVQVKEASIVGGEARSELWNQIKSDVLGLPIKQPEVEDAAALGSAILAAVGVGLYRSVKAAVENMVRIRRTFRPRLSGQQLYASIYRRYKTVYDRFEPAYEF